ncbi:uncharacterized protein DS421_1g29380 [Arachis hypogaea]|nr:uncharacterized protein DS421_1g29380 [Arachis hypogaea]
MQKKTAPKRVEREPENRDTKENKRKNVSEETSKEMEWRKCYVDTRCALNLLVTLSSGYLNDAQRNEVRAMGFGSLLGIFKGNLNHDLILALANAIIPPNFIFSLQ